MGNDTEMRRLRGFGDTNFVLLARDAEQAAQGPTPLPEVMFSFDAQGETERRWRVRHLEASEGLSTLYEYVVDLAAETLFENPDGLLGRYAVVQAQRESVLRRFYGVIRRVEHRGATGTHRLARIFMVPALWTLSQRSDARIFQDMTAVEVVEAVLREASVYVGLLDVQLLRTLPKREYCVQYRETDLAFVMRLLESEGITFFFRHEADAEALVLTDSAQVWDPVRTMDGGPVPIAGAEMATHKVETVRHLIWEREVRPSGVVVRDFDFTRPGYRVGDMEPNRPNGERMLYEPAPALTINEYGELIYTRDDAHEQARILHDAEQVRGAVGAGESVLVGLVPGSFFKLTLAGAQIPKQRYLVVSVEHSGDAPEEHTMGTQVEPSVEERYRNRFQCVPVDVPFRPPRSTPKPVIAGLQTATVTGPGGEEIYCDEHGRIRVQFHWDRVGANDEHSSCWLRAMQGPWSGNGWGFQFLPRIGMEVVVSFLEGDPDRPVIIGALYNGHNEEPFLLPTERTRAGVRTQSVGGAGFNELSFEDLAGNEQVYLHAQKNLDEVVLNDHTLRVDHDEKMHILNDRSVRVDGDQTHRVEGNERVTVAGDTDQLFVQDLNTRVGGRSRSEVTGTSDESVRDDLTVQVRGNQTTIVGRHEANRSSLLHVEGTLSFWSSRTAEMESEKDILLRCGKSMIRLTPTRIELVSPEVIVRGGENRVTVGGDKVRIRAKSEAIVGAEKVTVKSAGAAVKLDAEATVMGAMVHLNIGSLSLDNDPDDPIKVTTIELKDADGNPIPYQRFVILMGDGSEQSGMVNHEGKAIVELDEDAEVVFPELSGVKGS